MNYELKLANYNNSKLTDLDYALSFIKDILKKYLKQKNIKGTLKIDVYANKIYGVIINIKEEKNFLNKDAKITFNIDSYFLYEIDYFNIKKSIRKNNLVYYYKNKYYLYLNKEIKTSDYYQILEFSNIIYGNNSLEIINRGIKLT